MGKKKGKIVCDTQSEVSSLGGSLSTCKTNGLSDDESDSFDPDMKFKECVEFISNKNKKRSEPGLKYVKNQIQKQIMITLLTDYKETLSTELYKALRKSKGEFQLDLFKTLAALFLSISPDDASQIFCDVQRELLTGLSGAKKGSALCLAVISSVQFNPEEIFKTTDALRNKIKLAFLHDDNTIPVLKPAQILFITECIDAWKFIIAVTYQTPGFSRFVKSEIDFVFDKMSGILQQTDVDLRISTGEALSVIYEICRYMSWVDDLSGFEQEEDIIYALEDLASGVAVGGGSVKETTKKERKQQRFSFRQILEYIRDDEGQPIKTLHLNPQESLDLDNFCDHNKYEILCWCLESGISEHLTRNIILRSLPWFELGSVLPGLTKLDKANGNRNKLEEQVRRKSEKKWKDAEISKNRRNARDDHYYD